MNAATTTGSIGPGSVIRLSDGAVVPAVSLSLGGGVNGPNNPGVWPGTAADPFLVNEATDGLFRSPGDMILTISGLDDSLTYNIRTYPLNHGEGGRMRISRNGFAAFPPDLISDPPDPASAAIWIGKGIVAKPHLQNWLDCIKTRNDPAAPVEVGHRSITICHLAGIARELRRTLRWDPVAETFPDDEEARRLIDRPRREGWELPTWT